MVKKVILTALIVLFSAGLLGCWFYFVGRLETRGRQESRCDRVSVVLLDSLESAIVDKDELHDYVAGLAIGLKTDSIDLDTIERAILSRGEVMTAQVFAYSTGELAVELTQRKPVVRFDNSKERFYSDPEGYIFPVTNAVNVPLVTGKIPLNISAGYKGHAPEENRDWVMGLVGLAGYIDSRDILKREIEQIDIAENGDIVLYTATDGPAIIFGDSGDCRTKFRKLEAWWKNILPEAEAEGKQYKTINLKYNNQIICKQK